MLFRKRKPAAYDTLGVNPKASEDEIRSAYIRLVKANHPDLNREDPQAESRLKRINRAFEILKTQSRRERYARRASHHGVLAISARARRNVRPVWPFLGGAALAIFTCAIGVALLTGGGGGPPDASMRITIPIKLAPFSTPKSDAETPRRAANAPEPASIAAPLLPEPAPQAVPPSALKRPPFRAKAKPPGVKTAKPKNPSSNRNMMAKRSTERVAGSSSARDVLAGGL